MELKNKIMNLYEQIITTVKERKIVTLLKLVIVDEEENLKKIITSIPITLETLNRYVYDDSLMLNYLTHDELNLFREKMGKLLQRTDDKLQRLIDIVLKENITDVDKIRKLMTIGVDKIIEYIEDKKELSKYLSEEEIKVFSEKLKPSIEKFKPKLERLIECILVDGETDINVIQKKSFIKIETIKKHIENTRDLEKYLNAEELNLFLTRINKILANLEKKLYEEELNIVRKIIDDIYNTRLIYADICAKNFMPREKFESYFEDKEYMRRHFPEGTYEKVNAKKKENEMLRMRTPRDCFVIEDRVCVMLAKEDIHYLNQFDNRKLNFAAYYLGTGSNIDIVVKHFETSLQEALMTLASPKLETILKPEYYAALQQCLAIENLLVGNNLIQKKQMVIDVVDFLQKNDFDTKLAMSYFRVPEPLFNKILTEIIRLPYVDNETKQTIKNIFNVENEKKVK